MLDRIRAKILHAASPFRLAVLAIIILIALDLELAMANPLWTGGVIVFVSGLYSVWRPSEWQLRHSMSGDDKMIVPLRRSRIAAKIEWLMQFSSEDLNENMRYGDPDGSPSAVEFEMDRSIMVLGETGSGKSKAIEILAHQMQSDEDEPVVAFDYKEDYQRFFPNTVRVSSRNSDVFWNVFLEMRNEEDASEIAAAVFSTAENNYFTNSAEQVFADVLRMLRRWGDQDDRQPSNADLVKYLETADTDTLREDLDEAELSAAKHLPEDAEAAKNIVSNLEMTVTQVFSGDFAEDGSFSIREYMQNPQGETLILDFPRDKSESVKPIFRFFVDYSIRFGLLEEERGAFFILDEFAALPQLGQLERLVNAGRAYNCYVVLGVQSISQLNKVYGRDGAKALLSGLAQEVHLRVGEESVDYWRRRIGKERRVRGTGENQRVSEEHIISAQQIMNLEAGRGIIHTKEGWQRGKLFMLSEVNGRLLPREQSTFQRIRRYRRRIENRIAASDSEGAGEAIAADDADQTAIEETDE